MMKMVKNSNLEELIATLETIRNEKYPEVPKELLENIIMIEYENQDDRAEGQTNTIKVLDEFLDKLIN